MSGHYVLVEFETEKEAQEFAIVANPLHPDSCHTDMEFYHPISAFKVVKEVHFKPTE